MTPAERLLAAADLLDKRAGEATKGPWVPEAASSIHALPDGEAYEFTTWLVTSPELDDEGRRTAVVAAEREANNGSLTGGCFDPDDAAYIATMHPEIGKAVAKVLREEARRVSLGFGWTQEALALADLILAGAS